MNTIETWEVEEAARHITMYADQAKRATLNTATLAIEMIQDFLVWQVGSPNYQDYRAWDQDRLTDEEFAARRERRQMELAEWTTKVMAWVREQENEE